MSSSDSWPSDAERPSATEKPAPAKKPYQPPVFVRFGSLKDMTQAVSTKGNLDGKGKNRTGRGGRFEDFSK